MPRKGDLMKYIILLLVPLFTVLAFAKNIPIDTQSSKILWKGEKAFKLGDSHVGTLSLKTGSITLDEKTKMVTGGNFVVDMTSINTTDLKGEYKKKLESHLKNDDFFDVKSHPTATFKATKITKTGKGQFSVMGDLTIRGKTHKETFKLAIAPKGKTMVANGTLEFNRSKYNVMYNSESSFLKKTIAIAKDKVIKDKIQITLDLKTQSF